MEGGTTDSTLTVEIRDHVREEMDLHQDRHQGSSEAAAPPLSPLSPPISLLFSLLFISFSFLIIGHFPPSQTYWGQVDITKDSLV